MSQESNQHGQEEHYVCHEDADTIDEGPVRVLGYTGIQSGVVFNRNLV